MMISLLHSNVINYINAHLTKRQQHKVEVQKVQNQKAAKIKTIE